MALLPAWLTGCTVWQPTWDPPATYYYAAPEDDAPGWAEPDFDLPDAQQPEPSEAPELDFTVADSQEPLVIDTYSLLELANSKTLSIYDADYLGLFFEYPSVTAAETKQVVLTNDGIPQRFKDLFCWYIDAVAEKYPEADLRILHYNLQTLEVAEVDEFDLAFQALSMDAYGCYRPAENKIYVNRDNTYAPHTWEYQVIIHEFGHVSRTIQRTIGNDTIYIQFSEDYVEIPEEALNSLFTVSLFDYEERDIAYQLPSNLFQVMLECLDGYSLSDYINHSLSYLAHCLDLQTGCNNYAMSIFRLIDAQRADHLDDSYEREQGVYYPIYDYVCRLYLDRYGSADMDEAERTALVQELVERVTYDVPEEYPLDTAEFFRFAETYDFSSP